MWTRKKAINELDPYSCKTCGNRVFQRGLELHEAPDGTLVPVEVLFCADCGARVPEKDLTRLESS